MSLLGLIEASGKLIPLCPLYMRPIQQALAMPWDWLSLLNSCKDCHKKHVQWCHKKHLQWWTNQDNFIADAELHP
jgi:hypothetical protein